MPINFDYFAKKLSGIDACTRVLYWVCPWSVWFCSGGPSTRSVPERADEHVRAEHGEGLRLGHHEAMWVLSLVFVDLQIGVVEDWGIEAWSDALFFWWAATLKGKAQLRKMENKGQEVEHRCLVRASNGKKNISTSVLWPSLCCCD
jgi:hypothetical protein